MVQGKALIVKEYNSDGNMEIWSIDSIDEELIRSTRRKCLITNIVDAGAKDGKCMMMKSVGLVEKGSVLEYGGHSDSSSLYGLCFSTTSVG